MTKELEIFLVRFAEKKKRKSKDDEPVILTAVKDKVPKVLSYTDYYLALDRNE